MIEWRDKRDRLNVLLADPLPFDVGRPPWADPHPFEPRRYLNGTETITSPVCWCSAPPEHPCHKADTEP